MKYKFFGEPLMLVKVKQKDMFNNSISFKPLFRFNENGIFITDDIELIQKLKSRYDHIDITNQQEDVKLETSIKEEEIIIEEPIKTEKIFKCKNCDYTTLKKGELLQHYKTHKGGEN